MSAQIWTYLAYILLRGITAVGETSHDVNSHTIPKTSRCVSFVFWGFSVVANGEEVGNVADDPSCDVNLELDDKLEVSYSSSFILLANSANGMFTFACAILFNSSSYAVECRTDEMEELFLLCLLTFNGG